jgi:DNA-binding transcriptional ArsR family regulator
MAGKIIDKQMFASIVSHPVRCRALTILADREASPVEIGRELGMDPSHVAYHVKVLLEKGLIELTEEVPRRGSIEHRFRASFPPELSDEEYAGMSSEKRNRYSRDIFCFAAADASCAFSTGSFGDRSDHHISRMPLQVDEEGWSQLRDLYESTLRQIYEIKREAGDRLVADGVKGTAVMTFNTFFELPLERVMPRTFDQVAPS